MQDFLAAAYSHPMTLDIIRKNDEEKVRRVFSSYTDGWSDEKFAEAEVIISGIEFATLMKTEHSVSLPAKIEGALNGIMLLFGVPEDIRKMKIEKVLAMDYLAIGKRVYESFKLYVTELNEHKLEEMQNADSGERK